MKATWTKDLKAIKKAIAEDSFPVSLLALELREKSVMSLRESNRIARLLIKLARR